MFFDFVSQIYDAFKNTHNSVACRQENQFSKIRLSAILGE
jgi:hypothetical protein